MIRRICVSRGAWLRPSQSPQGFFFSNADMGRGRRGLPLSRDAIAAIEEQLGAKDSVRFM